MLSYLQRNSQMFHSLDDPQIFIYHPVCTEKSTFMLQHIKTNDAPAVLHPKYSNTDTVNTVSFLLVCPKLKNHPGVTLVSIREQWSEAARSGPSCRPSAALCWCGGSSWTLPVCRLNWETLTGETENTHRQSNFSHSWFLKGLKYNN